MGNSISVDNEQPDIWWPPPFNEIKQLEESKDISTSKATQTNAVEIQNLNTDNNDIDMDKKQNEIKMQQFKTDLEKKHLARREAIAERSKEILFLREELIKYKKENEYLKDLLKQNDITEIDESIEQVKFELLQLKIENEKLQKRNVELSDEIHRNDEISKQNLDLRKTIAETQKDLQAVNAQVLEFEKERHDYKSHVVALKDVIRVSKRLLEIRENQLQELRTKVADIETSLAEKEVSMLSTNLKSEYERQLENIRSLRSLYEQRQAAAKAERDLMASQLTDAKNNLENEQKKNEELQERIGELESNVSNKYDEIKSLESQLGLAKAEFRGLDAEMSAVNQLFSQILFDFNNCQDIDFDKLIKLLEENHDLLTNIVINEESEALSYALPKVLLDLVNQVNEGNKSSDSIKETEDISSNSSCEIQQSTVSDENLQSDQPNSNTMNSAEEIVNKLPKVWRVLTELLRQQCAQQPVDIKQDGTDPCYKSIETPKGPKLVLSVSKTFIRLKDLILEKKSLEKETTRLKQLNTHLETRLQDQEKRLETVSAELSKTWHVVGRMQRQHQQLHTHEKVLRYELAQKRKMLTELKEELEYCREKWEQAREKNTNTEEEWRKLRSEFASRKTALLDEFNNSAESGYSDERECSSDEDTFDIEKRKKMTNKISDNKHASDTDDADFAAEKQPAENKLEILEEVHSSLKTETEVQNQGAIKTEPANLETLDDVAALIVVRSHEETTSNDSENQNSGSTDEIQIASSSKEISQDERLQRREERLKRLEEQCQQLVNKVTNTTNRSTEICNRLETLHDQYGNDNSRTRTQNSNITDNDSK